VKECNLSERELTIKNCFHAWIIKDFDMFLDSFSDSAHYIESWGPAYKGIEQVALWFVDWNKENTVLEWDVGTFFHSENICICEWSFKWRSVESVDGFDGVSIITFDEKNKIVFLKEFQSKIPNYYPYEEHGSV